MAKGQLRKIFPDHWSFMLGEICLYSFVIIILTGIYLTLFFNPSMGEVVYHGSYIPLQGIRMSEAYKSTLDISFDVRGGLLIRQIHHWAAIVFVAGMLTHMMRVFFTGAFRKPRDVNWLFGFSLFVLGMFEGFMGYSLPDDLLSGTGIRFLEGALLATPVVGTYITMFLFGGEYPGHDIIPRLYSIHVLLFPALMVLAVVIHFSYAWYLKHTQFPGPARTENNVVGMPFMPVYLAKATGFFFLIFGVIAFVSAIASVNPIWTYGPYRPDQVSADAQPDWYMGFAEGLIRIMPGWEIRAWGHTLEMGVLIPLTVFGVMLVVIGFYPYFESWLTRDKREHHILDRPRNRPVRTGLGVAWLTEYLILLAAGGNDLFATRLHLSINAITWTWRILFFVGPVVTFIITKRWCMGLQRSDRDKVLHGRETGTIKRLPHGEYVEIHEQLPQEALYTLTAHEQFSPAELPPAVDENGVKRKVPASEKLRVKLSEGYFGEGSQIAKPTFAEQAELTGDHGHQ
ncbi:cytochrome bc complex cytochrome b subunit [Streptacidiphilus sp. MAP12-20]|uniref:cytochrome bc1 complex cytochrome b subunit n=1 Tax=Streptacidiphilus sp. MAP12-20 TaxID=3156299 RepID=UPI0035127F98